MQNKYRVINGDIKDDTGYHAKGDVVLMDEEQAAPLLAVNHLEPVAQDTMTAHTAPEQMVAVPDGFPERTEPVSEPTTPEPSAEAIAAPDQNSQVPPETVPANPSPEQIAKDMEQVA